MNQQSHSLRVAAVVGALLATTAAAQGVPQRLSFTGNLSGTGGPVAGSHNFVFTLFDAASGGTQAWTETQNALQVNNGLVFATLGTTTALTPTILNGAPLFLEVSVDGTVLSPRAAIVSVPYAVRAGTSNDAEALSGAALSELQRRVSGVCVGANAIQSISADGGVTCVSTSSGSTGDITDVTTAAGSGLQGGVASGNANLSLLTCTAGQVLKSQGATWACAADSNSGGTVTSVTAGAGLAGGTITGAGTIDIRAAGVTNAMLANNSVTVNPGTGLTGGGNIPLGGTVALGLSAPVAIFNGGTGLTTGPTGGGQYLRSVGTAWNVGTIQQSDLPALPYVGLAGNDTVGGTKTFSSPIVGSVSGSAASFTGTLAGDVTGTQGATSVVALRGRAVAATAPAVGNTLTYGGTSWGPAALDLASSNAVAGTLPAANGGTGVNGCAAAGMVLKSVTGGWTCGAAVPAPNGQLGFAWVSLGACAIYPCNTTLPAGSYNYNSGGGTIDVSHTAAGSYTVTFNGLNTPSPFGHVQVTAYGGGFSVCKVTSWGLPNVNIQCWTLSGGAMTLSNSAFDVLVVN